MSTLFRGLRTGFNPQPSTLNVRGFSGFGFREGVSRFRALDLRFRNGRFRASAEGFSGLGCRLSKGLRAGLSNHWYNSSQRLAVPWSCLKLGKL